MGLPVFNDSCFNLAGVPHFLLAQRKHSHKMVAMIPRYALLLLCASLLTVSPALAKSKAILPGGCGDDAVEFLAKQEKGSPAFAGPAVGKAMIVLVETAPDEQRMQTTIRFGVDGAWVGAAKGDSYFTFNIDPGDHKLCASMQSAQSNTKEAFTQVASFTAKAGMVYYFESQITTASTPALDLSQLSDTDGIYRLKNWQFVTSKPKK